jgi:uncharacterized protein
MAHEIIDAAMKGDAAQIKEILSRDPLAAHAASDDGWTALHLVSHFGHRAAASALLDAGASVSVRSGNAMHNLPIHAAVAGKKRELVELLLTHGSEVNATQHGGWTPLQGAAQGGDLETVQLLLERNADVNAKSDSGETALSLASQKGHTAVADLLRQYGANG